MKLSNQSGQSLVEILIAIGVAAILIGAATFSISIALRSNIVNQRIQIATGLAQELITKSRVITDAQWHDIYDLSKGTSTQYYAAPSSTRLFIIDGVEGMLSSEVVNSLVGHWKFDEATSTIAYDLSGSANHGTISGATRDTATNCKISTCLNFDGTNDYVDSDSNSIVSGSSGLTLSAWINTDTISNSNDQEIVSARDGLNGAEIVVNLDEIKFWLGNGSTNATAQTTDSNLTTGTWYFIVATYDGNTLKIYKDNIVSNNTATITGTIGTTTSGLGIGWDNDQVGVTNSFDGKIDDVRIYNRALSTSEISDLYESKIFTRYFSIENVSRDTSDDIVTSGGNDDPSTQKVIAYVEWSVGAGTTNFQIVDYFIRWKNKVINQGDWSGGSGQEGPITVPNDKYATSSEKINTTSNPGSFKLTL